jgi:Ras-related protein Rab-1A
MNWVKQNPRGDIPPGLIGHSMHAIGPDEVMLIGGFASDISGQRMRIPFGNWIHPLTVSGDDYIFNTQSCTWRRVETKGDCPSPRGFHASSYNIRAHKIVVHGGWTDTAFSLSEKPEMFVLDIDSLTWSRIELTGSSIPSSRAGHAMVYNDNDDSYIMFGDDKMVDKKLYRITTNGECSEIEAGGTRPLARRFLTLQLVNNKLYCFGGETSLPGHTDVYVYILDSCRWTRPLYEGSLSLRAQAGCVLNDKLMIFGGVRERASTTVVGLSETSIAKKLFFLTALEIKDSGPNDSSQFKFKIVTVGDSGVGKSCLLTRFVSDVYSDFHVSTIGVDYKTVVTMVKGKLVKLLLWDTAGQERFSVVTGNYYRNADAFVIVYDATERSSFEHVDHWLNQVRQHHECGPNTIKLLCANKCDLVKEVVVSETEGRAKAQEIGAIFVVTSAKTSGNVDMAFLTVAQQLVEMRKNQQLEAAAAATHRPSSQSLQLGSRLPSQPGTQVNCCV